MTYHYNNDNYDEPEDDYEFEDQIEREEEYDKYCNDIEEVHKGMMDYVSYCNNPSLMQYSDYFDLMNLLEKEEFKFTTAEKKLFLSHKFKYNNYNDVSYLYNLDLDLDSESYFEEINDTKPKTPPKPKTPSKPKTPKKKFTGWEKTNSKIENISDIQINQTKTKKTKGKYIPPSLR